MTPFHVGSRLDTRFFPIPSLLSPASSTSASRRIRLRVSRRFHLFRLANDVIRALNALYFSVPFSNIFCGFFSNLRKKAELWQACKTHACRVGLLKTEVPP